MKNDDYTDTTVNQGFEIIFNPPGDGSCQFAALAHQLSFLGIYRSPETVRAEIVQYLRSYSLDNDGVPMFLNDPLERLR